MFERQRFLIQRRIVECGLPIEDNEIKWYVAGGALRSVFAGEHINDLDIYFESQIDFDKFKEKYFKDLKPVFNTDNAISYDKNKRKIQLIKKFYGSPKEIIDRFDFSICKCAYVPFPYLSVSMFVFGDNFLEHLSLRILCYNVKGDHPINSLYRVVKFLKKGYKIPAVEIVKLALRINDLKITNYRDLKEELEGIDTILLKEFTDSLIGKKDNGYDFMEALGLITEYLEKKYRELHNNPEEDESFS